jgi:flavin-dependent dehydrogenase
MTPIDAVPASCRECDVLVIGGGPGGATTAALLARQGVRVVLLEKDRHPRFHIGESLLPANLPLLDELGVAAQVRAIGMQKWGAEFVSPWHAPGSQCYEFADAWDKTLPMAYQVRRSAFDEILIRNAAACGAEVIEGCGVHALQREGSHSIVRARDADGRDSAWRARWVVDASGRDTFLANRLKSKQRNRKHNSAALFAHYTGARRLDGKAQGNITIFWFDHGWFWLIPLADGSTSIGAVVWPYYLKTRDKPLDAFFEDTIAQVPELANRLAHAQRITPVTATGNYAYSCTHSHGPGYLLVGDAYAFIDPVFSSGVLLAMQGGFAAARALLTCLREPRRTAPALAAFDRQMRRGPREFSWFIYRVNHPTMRDLFMGPRNVLRMKEALLSVLAGDIYGKTPIWASLWLLKWLFRLQSMRTLRRTLHARKMRKLQIRSETMPGVS